MTIANMVPFEGRAPTEFVRLILHVKTGSYARPMGTQRQSVLHTTSPPAAPIASEKVAAD